MSAKLSKANFWLCQTYKHYIYKVASDSQGIHVILVGKTFAVWALISFLCLLELVGYVRARRFVVAILHILVSGTLNEKVKMRKMHFFYSSGTKN